MTPLRQRMIEEMELRNFAPKTVALYVDNVAKFAKHFGKSPELLGEGIGGRRRYDGRWELELLMNPAEQGQHRAFNQQLLNDASTARAE